MSKVYTSKEGIEVVVKEDGETTNHTGGINMSKDHSQQDSTHQSSTSDTLNTESSPEQDKKDNMATKILGGIALVLIGGAFGYFMNNQKPVPVPPASNNSPVSSAPSEATNPIITPQPQTAIPKLPENIASTTASLNATSVPSNINTSTNYVVVLEEKAKQGDPLALSRLGIMYLQGKDVEKNKTKAVDYLTQASQKNNDLAQYHLGIVLLQDKKYSDGIKLLEDAQKNGNPEATQFLTKVFHQKQPLATVITKTSPQMTSNQPHHHAEEKSHKSNKHKDEFSNIDKELDGEFKNFEKSLDKEFSKIDKELNRF